MAFKIYYFGTSLAPHERLTDLAVVPREKPHTGAAAREQPRDSPVIERGGPFLLFLGTRGLDHVAGGEAVNCCLPARNGFLSPPWVSASCLSFWWKSASLMHPPGL